MDAATSCNRTVAPIFHGALPLPAQETSLARLEEILLDEQGDRIQTGPVRIHRFPQRLRGLGGFDNGWYVVPSVVAIGPYHHGLPHLQAMEMVKHAAAYQFCSHAGCQLGEVYGKILLVSDLARFCYASGDAAVVCLSDAKLAEMMWVDGCFLLMFIQYWFAEQWSSRPSILKDIFLLENQIPWMVLDALLEFMPQIDVCGFVSHIEEKYFFPRKENKFPICYEQGQFTCQEDKPPPHQHLLGLLWYSQVHSMLNPKLDYDMSTSSALSISAAELDQIGLKLSASKAGRFGDTHVKTKMVFGKLCLSRVFLNDVSACWLVNMAALEARVTASRRDDSEDHAVVSSYISVLATLMDRKEDVHKLRRRGVMRSVFSNTQTLAFFKGLGRRVEPGYRYFITMDAIDRYMRRRPVRIAVYEFVYNNYRTVAKVVSVARVLFAIFKALLQFNPNVHK